MYAVEWTADEKLTLTQYVYKHNGHKPRDGHFKESWQIILSDLDDNSELFKDRSLPSWIGLHRLYKDLKYEVIKRYDINFADVSLISIKLINNNDISINRYLCQ